MPKISELNAITASQVLGTDLIAIAHDVNGLPSTKKISIDDFSNAISTAVTTNYTYANTTSAGVVKVGENLSVNATGYINASLTGYTGSQGVGFTGSIGSTGTIGYTGSTGSTGTIGYTGSTGTSVKTLATVSVTGPTTISSDITFADPNAAGANVNLILPSSPTSGSVYTVKNINAGGHVVYVQTNGVNSMETETGSIGSGVYATISSSGNYLTWVYDLSLIHI